MKRLLFAITLLIPMLASLTGVAYAAQAMELIEVSNGNSGPTFVFRVIGQFSRSELDSGFVSVNNGEDYPLYCSQVSADRVVCHTSKKVGGQDMVVGFGNARFWVSVPEQVICNPVYDFSYPEPSSYWQFQGNYCTGDVESDNDSILFYSPYWQDYYTYYYFPIGVDGVWENPGTGYYYQTK